MEEAGKTRYCHCTCMAGMGQSMYRIESAMRKGLTNPSCTSTANQWLRDHKEVQPMKVKIMNFGPEDFCQ